VYNKPDPTEDMEDILNKSFKAVFQRELAKLDKKIAEKESNIPSFLQTSDRDTINK
jgi:hypothetical protein|tara:strand:- start:3698 stop:3865 length:168 start_codon:yes stop_codon:yes gene_type:complete